MLNLVTIKNDAKISFNRTDKTASIGFSGSGKQDLYEASGKIRFPKDALQYIYKKLPDIDSPENFKYLNGIMMMLCENDTAFNAKNFIDFVSENNLSEYIIFDLPLKAGMNQNVILDLNLINRAKSANISPEKIFVPKFKDEAEALAFLEIGDVFQTPESDFVKIKTDESAIKKLKISPKTYLKLFPPVERFSAVQGFSKDCYLLSVLNAAFDNPKTRHMILSCFEEVSDGINVKYPNGSVKMFFKDGVVDKNADKFRLLSGPEGLKMLEYLYGYEILNDRKEDNKQIETLESINNRHLPSGFPPYNDSADYYRDAENSVLNVFGKIGLLNNYKINTQISSQYSDFFNVLTNLSDDKIVIAASSNGRYLSNGNQIQANHAYQIKPIKDQNGREKFEIVNSSNSSFYGEMSLKELMDTFEWIYISDFDCV